MSRPVLSRSLIRGNITTPLLEIPLANSYQKLSAQYSLILCHVYVLCVHAWERTGFCPVLSKLSYHYGGKTAGGWEWVEEIKHVSIIGTALGKFSRTQEVYFQVEYPGLVLVLGGEVTGTCLVTEQGFFFWIMMTIRVDFAGYCWLVASFTEWPNRHFPQPSIIKACFMFPWCVAWWCSG